MVEMLNLFNLGSQLKNILILIIALVALIAFVKIKELRGFLLVALVVVIGVSGVISTYHIGEYYYKNGVTVGNLVDSIFNNNVAKIDKADNYTFNYSQIGFASTGEPNQYQSKIIEPREIEIDLSQNWSVFINDLECNNNVVKDNEITATFTNAFFNKDKDLIMEDTLNISIIFHKKTFEIYLTTNGGDSAVKYWNTFLEKNDFILKLQKTQKNNNSINIDEIADLVTLILEDGTKLELSTGNILDFGNLLEENNLTLTKVKEIIVPEGVTEILQFNYASSSDCLIEKIVLPSTLETIYTNCFYGQTELTEIVIPDNVQFPPASVTASNKAFNHCTNLKTVTIGKNTILTKYLFQLCNNLETIYFNGTISEWNQQGITNSNFLTGTYGITITVQCTDGNIVLN